MKSNLLVLCVVGEYTQQRRSGSKPPVSVSSSMLLIIVLLWAISAPAQDLDALIEAETEDDVPETEFVTDAFLGTRVINLSSIELTPKGMLDFRISHRFGRLNSGVSELFGIDAAQIRFNLEYGVSDELVIGLARSSYRKTYEGYAKYRILRQRTGANPFPFTLLAYANVGVWSESDFDFFDNQTGDEYAFSDRLSYTYQLVFGRKFNKILSAQLSPTLVQFGLENTNADQLAYALGGALRLRVSPRVALTGEYIYLFNREDLPLVDGQQVRNSFSLGVDIETGGHNFQLHLTNAVPQNASGFVAQTTESWADGNIRFGFNIKRSFVIVKQ